VCNCGVCDCQPYYGSAINGSESCGCSLLPCDRFCADQNLTCDCGKCICPPNFGGPTCETCLNCIVDNCGGLGSCDKCLQKAECVWCQSSGVCQEAGQGTCAKKLTRSDGCPAPTLSRDQALGLGFGLLALVLCIGALLIGILKAIQMARERAEFKKWEEDQKRSKWDNNANPLFKKQEKEGNNQLYQGR